MNKSCIFCKSSENKFDSEEHVFPSALGNKDIVIPKGFICDKCNNGILSGLDNELINFAPISFFRTFNGVKNRDGKIPESNFNNISFKNSEENISANLDSLKQYTKTENGFKLEWKGNKRMTKDNLKLLARSLYKIGFELLFIDHGHDFIMSSRFDEIREIILEKKDFNGFLLIGTNKKEVGFWS